MRRFRRAGLVFKIAPQEFFVLSSSISQRSLNRFSFIHVDKEDPAKEVHLGAKEDEEVTDEVVYDKKKVVKLVDE